MLKRPRRNRRSPAIRSLIEETILTPSDLVVPFFVLPGENEQQPMPNLPDISCLSVNAIVKEAEKLHRRGIPAVILFPVVPEDAKDHEGNYALSTEGIVPRAIETLKREIPSLCVIADLALDPYTSHGHDGIVGNNHEILNDTTVKRLAEIACVYARAGADFIAPSDMMDGRVGAIRKKLDSESLENVGIIAYTAKYASGLYRPFRDILGSAPKFGDKKRRIKCTLPMSGRHCSKPSSMKKKVPISSW